MEQGKGRLSAERPRTIYDPSSSEVDPYLTAVTTELQPLGPNDLSNPTNVVLMLGQLHAYRAKVQDLEGRLGMLFTQCTDLQAENRTQAIQIARLDERQAIGWAQVVIGGFVGLGLSLVATAPGNGLAWAILIGSLGILGLLARRKKADGHG